MFNKNVGYQRRQGGLADVTGPQGSNHRRPEHFVVATPRQIRIGAIGVGLTSRRCRAKYTKSISSPTAGSIPSRYLEDSNPAPNRYKSGGILSDLSVHNVDEILNRTYRHRRRCGNAVSGYRVETIIFGRPLAL